jgi:hypothetical protein
MDFLIQGLDGGEGRELYVGKSHSSVSEVHSRGWRFLFPPNTVITSARGTIKNKSVGEKWMFQAGKQYITSL